jgi:hypothetical protein
VPKSFQNRRYHHEQKWILIIGSGVLVTGLAVAGVSLAKSDDSKVSCGTIRIEKLAEMDKMLYTAGTKFGRKVPRALLSRFCNFEQCSFSLQRYRFAESFRTYLRHG